MPNPTCSATCDITLPVINFDDCNPEVNFSEIVRFFIAKKGAAAFTNWLSSSEWLTRISETSTTGNDYIRALTVIGDKPAATDVIKEISNGRKKVIGKDHIINFTIDDVSQENYDFMRALECGGIFKFWYETAGGKIFGGNEGFDAQVSMNSVLARGKDEIETIAGVISWRAKFSPERGISPIFTGSSSIPTTFDTTLDFASSTTDSAAGVSGTAGSTDADQLFEFNAITPQVGTPQSMSIKVSSVEELTVDFTTDYLGQYFRYTDKAGVEHTGVFTNGDVLF
jgi:hypothetical protein